MTKYLLICVLVALITFPATNSHPHHTKAHTGDHVVDHGVHEVEEMSPEEQLELEQVESTLVEQVLPPPTELSQQVVPAITELLGHVVPTLTEVSEQVVPTLTEVSEQVVPTLTEISEQVDTAVAPMSTENKLKSGKYSLHNNQRTWAEATEYCRNDNQHLVRIETSLELRTVLAHFTDGATQVWTDGIGDLHGKKYVWATTGDAVNVDELEVRKENDDVFPKALVLERRGLIGEIQTTRLPFICESS